jgi:5,10-methylenetetrahydromethanopterin reductase
MATAGVALTRDQWRDRFAELEKAGCDYLHFQPAGRDIPRELEAFAAAYHR